MVINHQKASRNSSVRSNKDKSSPAKMMTVRRRVVNHPRKRVKIRIRIRKRRRKMMQRMMLMTKTRRKRKPKREVSMIEFKRCSLTSKEIQGLTDGQESLLYSLVT